MISTVVSPHVKVAVDVAHRQPREVRLAAHQHEQVEQDKPQPTAPASQPQSTPTPMGKFRFQVKLEGQWKNYGDQENGVLTRAYMSGRQHAKFRIRGGQQYTYDFTKMQQVNEDSGRCRDIRPPPNLKPPAAPLVPPGPTMVVLVPSGGKPGDLMQVPHPEDKSVMLQVE